MATSATASESAESTCTGTDTRDASGSDAGSSSSDAVPSLLSRLRAPSQSEIMRKRKIHVNQPLHTGGRKKKSVSVVQRVNEFPGEMLTNSAGELFCSACREELSLKLSIVKNGGHYFTERTGTERNSSGTLFHGTDTVEKLCVGVVTRPS